MKNKGMRGFILGTVLGMAITAWAALAAPAFAQGAPGAEEPSAESVKYAVGVAGVCLGRHWDRPSCLRVVSESTLTLAANYAGDLQTQGHERVLEDLKQHCAAATAMTGEEDYPADAMTSAFKECAEIMLDIATKTGVMPDPSHYQLLVGAVLCLELDSRCTFIEQGLGRYR